MKILIPMAGRGKRFSDFGYERPKPLIDVLGKPMIHHVVDSIQNSGFSGDYIFVVLEEHREFGVDEILKSILPSCEIVHIPEMTDGQLRSAFYAKELINHEEPLLIVNSDNYFIWDSTNFMKTMTDTVHGSILTFEDSEKRSHWSFARLENDRVMEVVEKEPISNCCLGGAFLLRYGSDFIKYGQRVFDKQQTKNGEYYISSVFNEMILDNKRINNYNVEQMVSMGTPDELQKFLIWYRRKNVK